jgi:SNF2 family DNA or RNA helicase
MISYELKKLGIKHLTMSGDDKPKEKDRKWRSYQERKDIEVFIAQIKSGGFGVELFKKDGSKAKKQHTLFYENDWDYAVRAQAVKRMHRIGQDKMCMYTDFIVDNTIDERVYQAIVNGIKIVDLILKEGVSAIV